MAFDSFSAFIAMGGHGPYVWACYIVFFALSIVLIQWSLRQRRAAMQRLVRNQAANRKTEARKADADFARVDPSGH